MVVHGLNDSLQRKGSLLLSEDSSQDHSAPELFRSLGRIEESLGNVKKSVTDNDTKNENDHEGIKTDLKPVLSFFRWAKMTSVVVVSAGALSGALYGILVLADKLGSM